MVRITNNKEFIVIGGQTGCGKTMLLNEIDNSIDLEGLANHRGSAFGNNVSPQPKQIDFENNLSIELIKKESFSQLLIEDEGNNIGMIHIPDSIKLKSRDSKIILLTASLEDRLRISLKSYVVDMERQFKAINSEKGFENFSNYWLTSLYKIQKRLGGDRYQSLLTQLKLALKNHQNNGDINDYLPLIESLLVDYYDPMYNFQINNKKQRVIFEGNCQEVKKFLEKN
jgi:tRNA 2-selenouridine synthase